jgi:hypothetical protein
VLPVFFAAMRRKYAEDGQESVPLGQSEPEILFEIEKFKVLYYLVARHGQYTFEQVIVLYENVPVWTMAWEGWCLESAMPFLRHVLRGAAERRNFWGGRGPRIILEDSENGMVYENDVEGANSWVDFRGRDEIVDGNDQVVGRFHYHGFLFGE